MDLKYWKSALIPVDVTWKESRHLHLNSNLQILNYVWSDNNKSASTGIDLEQWKIYWLVPADGALREYVKTCDLTMEGVFLLS